jgi:hypothetical protein
MVGHQPYKLAQTVPENRIIQVPSGLIQIPNGVAVGHSASSETRELWKNEPHPMGALTSARKFLDDLRVDLRLSVDEANEVSLGHSRELRSSGLCIKYYTQGSLSVVQTGTAFSARAKDAER